MSDINQHGLALTGYADDDDGVPNLYDQPEDRWSDLSDIHTIAEEADNV